MTDRPHKEPSMNYETAVRIWASEQFRIPLDQITSVEFDYDDYKGCPTCGYEGVPLALVYLTDGTYRREPMDYEFAEMVTALVQVAIRDASEERP